MCKSINNENCISTNEMLSKLGYKTVTPVIGSLGQALMQASRENPDCAWLKQHEDKMFKKLRKQRKEKRSGN